MTKYANLTDEQRLNIESSIKSLGLLKLEDGRPTEVVMCERVTCPLCKSPLEVYTSGNSFQISCHTDGKIRVVRAFAQLE